MNLEELQGLIRPEAYVGWAKGLYSYTSSGMKNTKGENELSFQKGDVFPVLEWREEWILVRIGQQVGIVPSK